MLSLKYINCSFKLGNYECENKGCPWSNYVKYQDWGYYSETENDCHTCQDRCEADINCGAVECGEELGYCSWWKKGKCSRQEATVSVNTCRKCKY